MRRVSSTPETRQLRVSSLSRHFPMRVSDISDLEAHHEHEQDDEEKGSCRIDECEEDNDNEGNPFCAVENFLQSTLLKKIQIILDSLTSMMSAMRITTTMVVVPNSKKDHYQTTNW